MSRATIEPVNVRRLEKYRGYLFYCNKHGCQMLLTDSDHLHKCRISYSPPAWGEQNFTEVIKPRLMWRKSIAENRAALLAAALSEKYQSYIYV